MAASNVSGVPRRAGRQAPALVREAIAGLALLAACKAPVPPATATTWPEADASNRSARDEPTMVASRVSASKIRKWVLCCRRSPGDASRRDPL